MKYIKTFEQFVNESQVNEASEEQEEQEDLQDALDSIQYADNPYDTIKFFKKEEKKYDGKDYGQAGFKQAEDFLKKYNLKHEFMEGGDGEPVQHYINYYLDDTKKSLGYIQIRHFVPGFELGVDGNFKELYAKGKKARNLGFAFIYELFEIKIEGIKAYSMVENITVDDMSAEGHTSIYFDDKNLKLFKEYLQKKAGNANESIISEEYKFKELNKKSWSKMKDDDRMEHLLAVHKDPDDAEAEVEKEWDNLSDTTIANLERLHKLN